MNDSIRQLEEKIAYLERHVTEQDKAMFELGEEIAVLRREMKALRARSSSQQASDADSGGGAEDERPPHY